MDEEECWVRRRLRMCCIVCNISLFVAQITNVLLNVFFLLRFGSKTLEPNGAG